MAAPIESALLAHTVVTSLSFTGIGAGALLLARRRFPLAAGLGVQAVLTVGAVVGGSAYWASIVVILAGLLAAWTLGHDLPVRTAVTAGVAGLLLTGVDVALAPAGAGVNGGVALASEAGCWLAGAAFRRWSIQARDLESQAGAARALAAADARRAVADERSALARELHDVVSHSVTVMTLQAGGARMLLGSDRSRALEAIRAVEECGREALQELRRMGDVLPVTSSGRLDPEPGLDRLDELFARVRVAGLELVLSTSGAAGSLTPGLDLTLYRILQEGLTNALRYGCGRAELWIGYERDGVKVELSNPARRPSRGGEGGGGLVGLRERAALFGGTLEAGMAPDGRFVLSAWLPA